MRPNFNKFALFLSMMMLLIAGSIALQSGIVPASAEEAANGRMLNDGPLELEPTTLYQQDAYFQPIPGFPGTSYIGVVTGGGTTIVFPCECPPGVVGPCHRVFTWDASKKLYMEQECECEPVGGPKHALWFHPTQAKFVEMRFVPGGGPQGQDALIPLAVGNETSSI